MGLFFYPYPATASHLCSIIDRSFHIALRLALCLMIHGLVAASAHAQTISGTVPVVDGQVSPYMKLQGVQGGTYDLLDSVPVGPNGTFKFPARAYALGFYELTMGPDDRVDLILGERKAHLVFNFTQRPLQDGVVVKGSPENERLWAYKYVSRDAQRAEETILAERREMDPLDQVGLAHLDSARAQVHLGQKAALDGILAEAPESYFARVVRADRHLMAALEQGPTAIRYAMDWTDASLVRSAIYAKGIMAMLQSSTPATPDVLWATSDSILAWASPDTTCWRFARGFLVDLFIQYGPDEVVQHIVDRHIMGSGALLPPEPRLLDQVKEQLKVALGSMAPDVLLPRPGVRDTVALMECVRKNRFTVLFFYSSTCDHCHAEMPGVSAVHQDLREAGVAVVGVALDADVAEFEENITQRALPFPCYTELIGWGSPAAKAFAVKATPSLIILDRTGKIVGKPYDHVELREQLDRLLR
jgi:peroxiredoxin